MKKVELTIDMQYETSLPGKGVINILCTHHRTLEGFLNALNEIVETIKKKYKIKVI